MTAGLVSLPAESLSPEHGARMLINNRSRLPDATADPADRVHTTQLTRGPSANIESKQTAVVEEVFGVMW